LKKIVCVTGAQLSWKKTKADVVAGDTVISKDETRTPRIAIILGSEVHWPGNGFLVLVYT